MRFGNKAVRRGAVLLTLALMLSLFTVLTAAASDDNSLADLGITTAGATVSPEFRYDIWEYNVTVPAGTTELALSPHTTNPSATINSVTGTTLNADGTGTVIITVTSESGNAIEYVLHVSAARGAVDPAAAIAANEAGTVTRDTEVVQSEVETEDPRYVKVDRNSLQEAENTIERLRASEAFRLLYSESAFQRWHDAGHKTVIDRLMKLSQEVPVYLLRCTPDERAVRLLHETVFTEELT
jgi:hypothetical protein